MNKFDMAHIFTARWEGGLSDHPADRGGITAYGVSLAFLRGVADESQANRDTLERMGIRLPVTADVIRGISAHMAATLFRWQFWDRLRLDEFPVRVGTVLYDAAVNHGRARSVRLAQQGYNACVGVYGGKLAVDGMLGPLTRAALKNADTDKFLSAMIDVRIAFYSAIVASNASQSVFLRGWLGRAEDLRKYIQYIQSVFLRGWLGRDEDLRKYIRGLGCA